MIEDTKLESSALAAAIEKLLTYSMPLDYQRKEYLLKADVLALLAGVSADTQEKT